MPRMLLSPSVILNYEGLQAILSVTDSEFSLKLHCSRVALVICENFY